MDMIGKVYGIKIIVLRFKKTFVGEPIKVEDWVNHFVTVLDHPVTPTSILWAKSFIENKLLDLAITFGEIKLTQ